MSDDDEKKKTAAAAAAAEVVDVTAVRERVPRSSKLDYDVDDDDDDDLQTAQTPFRGGSLDLRERYCWKTKPADEDRNSKPL